MTLNNLPTAGRISVPSRPISGPRVLVVDDEPLIRQLNTEILEEAGYQVEIAADGAAAWNALQSKNYDLEVTDNQMPKVSGVDLVVKIRTAGMVLPVIMATGTLPEEEFTRHLWLHPFIMLLKPYSLMELLGAVKSILQVKNNDSQPESLLHNWECQPLAFGLRLC